jgi:hypothetical protein
MKIPFKSATPLHLAVAAAAAMKTLGCVLFGLSVCSELLTERGHDENSASGTSQFLSSRSAP